MKPKPSKEVLEQEAKEILRSLESEVGGDRAARRDIRDLRKELLERIGEGQITTSDELKRYMVTFISSAESGIESLLKKKSIRRKLGLL